MPKSTPSRRPEKRKEKPHSDATASTSANRAALDAVRGIIRGVGEDPTRQGLRKTPERFLDALRECTAGYSEDPHAIVREAIYDSPGADIVVVRGIEFYSLCEHHLLPFYGKCHIGYLPGAKVAGLSKLPRVVEVFARRLQLQEKLTQQVATVLDEVLAPHGVMVVTEAYHMCMMMRGVKQSHAVTVSESVRGAFADERKQERFRRSLSGNA